MSLEEEGKGGLVQGVAVGYCYRGMLEWLPSLQNAVLPVLILQLLRVLIPNFSATPFGIEAGGKRTFPPFPRDRELMQRGLRRRSALNPPVRLRPPRRGSFIWLPSALRDCGVSLTLEHAGAPTVSIAVCVPA